MFAALKNGMRCYIDINGKTLLETEYKSTFTDFFEERASVLINNKWGFINQTGVLVIEPQFEEVFSFSENLCAVKYLGKWGYIDGFGKFVIPPKYHAAGKFSNGLAAIQTERLGDISYINEEGKVIIPDGGLGTIFSFFCEGLLPCRDNESRLFGCRNTKGEWHISPQYVTVQNFSEGLAGVLKEDTANAKTAFIDTDNNEILPAQYETVLACFKENRAIVTKKIKGDYMSGCINRKGDLVIPFEFYMIKNYSDGLAQAKLKENDKWGFINKKGAFQIKPDIEKVYYPFRDGLALIQSKEKVLKYINKKGEVVFEFS